MVFISPLEAVVNKTIFMTTMSCKWVESASRYFIVVVIAAPI